MNVLLQRQWDDFLKSGLPTKQEESWKYTDLSFLAKKKMSQAKRLEPEYLRDKVNQHRLPGESIFLVFVNGYYMPMLSDIEKLPKEVIARSLNEALVDQEDLIKQHWVGVMDQEKYPFARLNLTMFNDGLFLQIPDQCEVTLPIHILSLAADEMEFIAQPHHLIVLGKHSQLTILEEHVAFTKLPYMMNILTTISVGEGAVLQHNKIQTENIAATHMANFFIRQAKDSQVTLTNFSSGAQFARDDVVVSLKEAGAECRTGGFYYLRRDDQYLDNHIDIEHRAPHSQSEMLYKGILDKKSKAVFNGRLYVEKDAQKILAYQANHHLLLSQGAEAYSKPELEIYADDVKCKHGATTGQLDQEALFYMRSRGISLKDAMEILLQSFAEEIIERVTHPEVKNRCRESLL